MGRVKNCPFCGSFGHAEQRDDVHFVACGSCGAEGPAFADDDDDDAEEQAKDAWNDRPLEAAARARETMAVAQARTEGEIAGFARALAAIEARAVAREAQVAVAAEAGGEVDAVRLKAGELRAVAEDIRREAAGWVAVTR